MIRKILLLIPSILILFSNPGFSQEIDPIEIIRKAELKFKGNSSRAETTMKIIRPDWSREIQMKSWSMGGDYLLILIQSPARDKGTAFLKRKKEIWNWQPSIERTIKLPPSMMSQSWMGSDFTNDDLVQEASMIKDYTHKYLGSEDINGRACHKLELIPKEDAAVVWGKIITWVDEAEDIYLKSEFYDEDGFLINTMRASDLKEIGGKFLATRMEMVPEDKPGNKTVIEYKLIEFEIPVNESFFSVQNMKRIR